MPQKAEEGKYRCENMADLSTSHDGCLDAAITDDATICEVTSSHDRQSDFFLVSHIMIMFANVPQA